MKKLFIFVLLFVLAIDVLAQDSSLEQICNKGLEFYDKKDYKRAYPFLLEAAEKGYAYAQFLIGRIYEAGYGVEKNYEIAMIWYLKAAEQGNAKAQNNIGAMYFDGTGVDKDYNKAFEWYLKAANTGNSLGQLNVGSMYFFGYIKQNYDEALKWFQKAAAQNDEYALLYIGQMYWEGKGVTKNTSKAEHYLKQSSLLGLPLAQYYLGQLYETEFGTFKDLEEAAKWYRKSAESGDKNAQYSIGAMYYTGKGLKRDYNEAITWLKKSSDQNNPRALNLLGYMYQNGHGVSKNYSKALTLYRKAAEQGYANAQYNLGIMYNNGWGVKRDDNEAAWLFRKAAEQGHSHAQYCLGIMYENGYGVIKDLTEAIKWYQKASESDPNNENAQNALNRLGIKDEEAIVQDRPSSPDTSETASTQKVDDGISIDASGTGFVIDKRGFLATNHHVTKGARGIYVCLQKDGAWKSYNAILVKNDPINDLSIIRIDDPGFVQFTSLPYNFSIDIQDVASDIFTLGYPQVHIMGTEVKYTAGSINSKSGIQGDPTHYQISAHIDHGNSGGPMFNSKGTIIGITDSGLDKAEFGDVNYAIKSSYLKSLVDALPVKLELPHDNSIEKLSRVEQIKVLSKYTALILIDLP